jgi:hypothetical protein
MASLSMIAAFLSNVVLREVRPGRRERRIESLMIALPRNR